MIVTIALPTSFEDPNVDSSTAPVWIDAAGTEYLVVSGFLDPNVDEETLEVIEYETSDPIEAQPDRINVVVEMNGLAALAAMGLSPKPTSNTI